MYVMFDSTTPDAIPRSAPAVAGYTSGFWPDYLEDVKRWPHAHHLSIAVNAGEDAMCLDVEKGDATAAEAPGWYRRQRERGLAKPYLYASLSPWGELRQILESAGIPREGYFAWAADYTYVPHIPTGFDACQWTDRALGRNLDESLCSDTFFRPTVVPSPLDVLLPAERRLVNTYDHYIKHPQLHEHGLRVTRNAIVVYRKLIWLAAVKGRDAYGRPLPSGWGVRDRAARYRLLLERTRGVA
jgi:hypothetical protein